MVKSFLLLYNFIQEILNSRYVKVQVFLNVCDSKDPQKWSQLKINLMPFVNCSNIIIIITIINVLYC